MCKERPEIEGGETCHKQTNSLDASLFLMMVSSKHLTESSSLESGHLHGEPVALS